IFPCNRCFRARWARGGALVALMLLLAALMPVTVQAGGRHTVVGWGMEEGLPHNLVQSLAQGSDGFLWIGTWEGVVRFHGRHVTVFDRQNRSRVETSGMLSIVAGPYRTMLFGTASNGVYRSHNGQWQPLGGEDARTLSVVALLPDDE